MSPQTCPRIVLAVGAAVGFLAASAAAQPRMVLIAGGSVADANSDVTVLVGAGADASGANSAIRWTVGSSIARSLIGGHDAVAVSADGTVVAGNELNTGGVGGQPTDLTIGSRWTLDGGVWQNVGTFDPPGNCGSINTVYDISGDGRFVVGGGWVGGCGTFRAYVYDAQAATFTNLGGLGGPSEATRANSVSANGSVIVGFDSSPTTGVRMPAVWHWDPGTQTYVETLLNAEGGEVFEINSAGTIMCGTSFEFPGELVRWTADGQGGWTAQGLGIPAGPPSWAAPSYVFENLAVGGMSEDGNVIVGIVQYVDFFFRVRGAFIWTPDTAVPKDMRDYLAELPAPPPGLASWPAEAFTSAIAVSADGGTIVGNPIFVAGAPGAWLIDLDGGACIAPSVASDPSGLAIDACSSFAVLNASFSGAAPFTLQWYKDGQPVVDGDPDGNGSEFIGANSAQLLILSAVASDAGSYTCAFTNDCGTATTAPALVTAGATLPNDTCAGAAAIGEETVTWSPCGAAITDGAASCVGETYADVWFRYTPTFTGPADFTTCGSTSMDTVLSILDDGCEGWELACSDDCPIGCDTGFGSARIDRFSVTAGQPVLVRVAAVFPPDSSAIGSLTITPSAAGPANDLCSNPTPVGEGETLFDSSTATTDFGVSCAFASVRDVWFRYTPSFTGDARITTCGTEWNTVLTVHSGECGEEIACADDAGYGYSGCGPQASRISRVPVTAGQDVFIRVAGAEGCSAGPGTLTIAQAPAVPVNDTCANAAAVGVGEHLFDLTEATDELVDGCDDGTPNSSRDIWFRLAPSCAGVYTIDTCGSAVSDPMLHVLDACAGSIVACNDNLGDDPDCGYFQSRLTGISAGPSNPVLIRVSSAGDFPPFDGTGVLRITRATPACPADQDCNGTVNSGDISNFLTAWIASVQAGDLVGDFNADGATNSGDISAFLTAWITAVQNGGC